MNLIGELVQAGDWVYRLRLPEGEGPFPVVMLLHGWTGDENSMALFTSRLPRRSLLIFPRGLYTSPLGGYGWQPHSAPVDSWVDDFSPACEALSELLSPQILPLSDLADVSLAGFSQGAALAFTFALLHPSRVRRVAGLASFLPQGAEALARSRPLVGKPVFVAHGSRGRYYPHRARL